ncbi:MAG: 30S ribosome-binding factor RbfA [Bdellovibrionales bacterium]|nr:30S ribosome-binding factor RbfA [Bdellovibrionales bacterium]
MGSERRTFRVAQAIREQVSRRLLDSSDDRFHFVTVTGVLVSNDLRHAKVYWMHSGQKDRVPEITAAFEKARGFFRHGLAEGLNLRYVPDLRFYYDDTLDTAAEIDRLLDRATDSE